MKKSVKILPIFLAAALFFGVFPMSTTADDALFVGDGLTAEVSGDTLTISGSGTVASHCTLPDGVTKIVIENGVEALGDSAFLWCGTLTEITLPDTLLSIGPDAFNGCYSLTAITLPDGLLSIGSTAFERCSGLTEITVPDSVTSLGAFAFYSCSALQKVTLGGGLGGISQGAFEYCSALGKIDIPDGVLKIQSSAFEGCGNLTEITIPRSVTSIGNAAFAYCRSLETVNFTGTADEWNEIGIGTDNDNLLSAEIIFNAPADGENLPQIIGKIVINDADITPVLGEKAGDHKAYSLPEGSNFTPLMSGWFDVFGGRVMEDDDVFEGGRIYCPCWNFVADEGYAFAGDVTVIINDSADIADTEYCYLDTSGDVPVYIISAKGVFLDTPTTQAPTTEAPTTEAPTTEAPTTEAPTTEAPTTEKPTDPAPQFSTGDVNHDGKVKANDARLTLRFAAGLEAAGNLDITLADVNADGKVKANDARLILRAAAGLEALS